MNVLTRQHRAQQLLLRRATVTQVERLWPLLDGERLDATYPRLAVPMAALVQKNRETSSGLTAAYLRALRRAEGVSGVVRPEFADRLIVEQFGISLRTTSVAAAKAASGRGAPVADAMGNALTLTKGSMARLVLNGGRETLTRTVRADDRAAGWQRVLGGSGCDFCQMLTGRGAVYGEASADFEAHDHCGCTAEPVYRA